MQDIHLIVKGRIDGSEQYELFNVCEVYYIDFHVDFSTFIMDHKKYLCPITKVGLIELIENLNFRLVDRDLYVNMDHVKKIHSLANAIVFSDVSSYKEVQENKLPCVYINSRRMNEFSKLFSKEQDLAYKIEANKDRRSKAFSFRRNTDYY
ncbi:hypothetical protein [Paenibacillus oleatilyticus]|uniref:hypothetical protein n=1 Tax=Paenibacillus oleatilyticus TaxID=2594886 RepID=UPI001C1F88E4|nr:hypothetical protein [Paenibacillus oleatilyticus]MBU7316060.1 hypothetical protein [Paenibacillus oleatilyticus]